MMPQPMTAVELETWENRSPGLVYIHKYDAAGRLASFRVNGGQRVQLTPQERRLNQEKVATADLDVFQNGRLAPIRLVDSDSDTEELQNNVNAMSDTAMKALFRSQVKTFTAKVNEIANPIALQRLLEVAREVDASLKQNEIIQARLAEVTPKVGNTESPGGGFRNIQANEAGAPMRGITPR